MLCRVVYAADIAKKRFFLGLGTFDLHNDLIIFVSQIRMFFVNFCVLLLLYAITIL